MLLAKIALALAVIVPQQGLSGLGAPGGLLKGPDARVLAFETKVLAGINDARKKHKLAPLVMDETLRSFVRPRAEQAAKGSTDAKAIDAEVQTKNLAPHGHRLQLGFGETAGKVVHALLADKALAALILGAWQRVGIGAFWVPADKPYFQFALLLVSDPDPMAGKPGLSQAQTDPVMAAAGPAFKACYDGVLKRDPNRGGDVILQIVIGKSGRVDSYKLLRSLGDPVFDRCAEEVIQRLRFPEPYKGKAVTLNHPLRFTPPQGNKKVGRLSGPKVAAAFGSASSDLRACYDKAAKNKPALAGTLSLALVVSAAGSVNKVEVVHDEPGDKGLTACVLERIKRLHFARPEFGAEVEVTYPLRFGPKAE